MHKIKVLLVDDEEDYVKTMAERMEMRDVTSRVALSGNEALQMVDDETPDVMVLDLRMPGIDGMEALERVKKEHPNVQVVILTGHGSEQEEKEALRLGAYQYLQKPADTNQILSVIRSAWSKSVRAATEFVKESKEEFEISAMAAAYAEGGVPEMSREVLEEDKTKTSSKTPAAAAEATARTLKVLLVDDEEDLVRTMAERMEMRDLGSDVAFDGQQALKMVEDEMPDVMVLDLRMPGLDGLEVLRRVKGAYPQIAVVIMTGHGSDKDEKEARRLGAFDYLRKPVDISHLMEVVKDAGRTA
jgi:DNA-binding NtrC family response regulator